MTNYPTVNLQPGSTGTSVKQLQDYLVSKRYMTQEQVNTGYGTYGPRTTAAVAKLQQDLGVDTAGNPGYWGPRTLSKLSSPSTTSNTTTTSSVTAKYQESAAYKALPKDQQDLVNLGFSTFIGTTNQQQLFNDALTKAQALADPYAKSQIALFKAEYGTAVARITGDYATQKEILDRTRKDLAETLKTNTDNLSLEQQSDIAQVTKEYDVNALDIADQAAEKGLTFATGARSRALAEERNTSQFQDVIQSTNRKYNFQKTQLELRAKQGDTEAAAKLEEIKSKEGFNLQDIGQNAEKVLGSTGAAALGASGLTPEGGNLGTIEQERRRAVLDATSLSVPTGSNL